MQDPAAIIMVESLSKQVLSPEGILTILDDISFSLNAKDALAIVGISGSGKSTLLGQMAGLDVPSQGRVILDGTDLNTLDEDGRARLRAERVGFVFQSFQLLPSLTALENVMLPLELADRDNPAEAAKQVLKRVGLEHRFHHYPNQLSGGEQQRVALARAFAPNPKILFADEPTGNLDRTTATRIVELLLSLTAEQNTTLVIVTHDAELSARCTRVIALDGGRIAHRNGPTKE
jgi:putative ABC transport system ATP-binding protein